MGSANWESESPVQQAPFRIVQKMVASPLASFTGNADTKFRPVEARNNIPAAPLVSFCSRTGCNGGIPGAGVACFPIIAAHSRHISSSIHWIRRKMNQDLVVSGPSSMRSCFKEW